MDLAVIILSYRNPALLKKCLESVFKYQAKKMEVWVVDNASGDQSVEMVKKNFPEVNLIESPENGGFAKGNNLALKKAEADYYLILNPDTEVRKGSLDGLVDFMERTDFGIVSCKLEYPDGSFQPNGGDIPNFWPLFVWISGLDDVLPGLNKLMPSFHRKFANFYQGEKEIGWVQGAAMLIRKSTLNKIGYLDENIFMYCEDVEYCMRAKTKGIKVGWTDHVTIMHVGGGSFADPSFNQWAGELRGLIYLYKKYKSNLSRSILKILIYIFTTLRMIAFGLLGRRKASKTYAKILLSI